VDALSAPSHDGIVSNGLHKVGGRVRLRLVLAGVSIMKWDEYIRKGLKTGRNNNTNNPYNSEN
jgi:hypothetical protein